MTDEEASGTHHHADGSAATFAACTATRTSTSADEAVGARWNQVTHHQARRAPWLDYLELSWFGGEPLLAKDIVFDIAGHAANLRQAVAISATGGEITTNGYLLDRATLHALVGLDTALPDHVDGDEREHNRHGAALRRADLRDDLDRPGGGA